MIPTRYAYYRNRAHEHRRLAELATERDTQLMHDRLVKTYTSLARQSRLREVVILKA